MRTIKDYKAIYEYRKRRQERLDGRRLDDEWKTIKGTHVMVDDDGQVTKGPDKLRNQSASKRKELKVGGSMKPINSDYLYEDGDDENDFTHKNIEKLKKIYEEHGIDACHDEWLKFLTENSTKNLHPMTKDEADEVMYDNVRQSQYDGWFRNADSSYKPGLTEAVIRNPEMRNAALNLAYENYRWNTDEPLSFEEFLVTPIKMYRGENGQKHRKDDVFDAYTFDKKTAEYFADKSGKGGGTVTEIEARPIDTYGSMRAVGEAEIWVPRQISPVGYKRDARADGITWKWNDPMEFAIEDKINGVEPKDNERDELIGSIIQDAETIKLFGDKDDEVGKNIKSRCVDMIQRTVKQLTAFFRESNGDSAFFSGELNENIGERNVQYPEVEAYRERRQKRLDAKPDSWITVNGNHIPLDEDKNPIGGQEKAFGGDDEVAHSEKKEPVSKRRANQKLYEIADSDKSDEEKVEAIVNELKGMRNGTKLVMPDSWDDDDGKKQIYKYNADLDVWEDNHGWGSLDVNEMAWYFLDKDPNERPKIQSIPRDSESLEASRKKREESKNYAMSPNGSIDGKYTLDFHNDHVSQEERDAFKKEIDELVEYEKGFDESRSLYRNEANRVGDKVADEIKRRASLRRGDKENAPINDQPQVEDIYDVLKDMRDFGMPDGFKPRISSDLPEDRTNAIIKEAFDRFPTEWLKDARSVPVINIIDGPGRAICLNDGYINVYTKKDLGLSSGELTTLNDRALVNDLAHELGHYIEWNNQKVQYSARDCLWERGKDTEIIEVEPGYNGYKDSFFSPYMGKIYSHGGTEIISMLMGNIGCFQPFSVLEGHEYDYAKGKYDGRKKKDKESLKYVLGVLAGL